ncbi:MAG: hypothetical protein U5R14_01845 [Gemmatimonadota bacterium]|nr:hypothetical protein [Gemmatimonadota bacterium]
MDTKTKKKLEAGGWKTGDARDFLELSDAEAEFIEMKPALGRGSPGQALGADFYHRSPALDSSGRASPE